MGFLLGGCFIPVFGYLHGLLESPGSNLLKMFGWEFGSVLLIIPSLMLVPIKLLLAARIFTWRHPVGGSKRLFWNTKIVLYGIVLGLVAMILVVVVQDTFMLYRSPPT